MHARAAELIATLELRPHPEGGFYREIYRSRSIVTPADGRGERCALTTIYFLLPGDQVSRWHRVASDEVWHLYEGALELLVLDPRGENLVRQRLEHRLDRETSPTHTVPATYWQAARPLGAYALVGCTVAPGFDFADFTMLADDPALGKTIRATWPAEAKLI